MNPTYTNEEWNKLVSQFYQQYRGEWLELKNNTWHWRAQPFINQQAAKKAIDKAMIIKAQPKGTFLIGWKKAI